MVKIIKKGGFPLERQCPVCESLIEVDIEDIVIVDAKVTGELEYMYICPVCNEGSWANLSHTLALKVRQEKYGH